MTDGHAQRLRAAFTAQAATIEDATLGVAFTAGLDWLIGLAQPRPEDLVVDLAGGTGLVARALAPRTERVVVVDLTPTMLHTGRRAATANGVVNVGFVRADATAAPLPDTSCSLAVTRFSLHHVPDPGALLDELVRLTRPGGRIVVKDLVTGDDETHAARQDEIEILRDPSHLRTMRSGEVAAGLRSRGCTVRRVARRDLDRPLQPWLEQGVTPPERAARIRERFADEIEGGPRTGLRPHRRDGQLWFRHPWEVTVAER